MNSFSVSWIHQSIRYRNYKSLIDELGVSWGELGTPLDYEEALNNADQSFFKCLKPILESLQGLDASDYSIMTMLIQQYLYEHPVRAELIKMVIMQKSMEPIRIEITPAMLANFLPVNKEIGK